MASDVDVDLTSAVALPLVEPLPMRCSRIFGARHGCTLKLYFVARERRRGGGKGSEPLGRFAYQVR